jgi:hypothetical protein
MAPEQLEGQEADARTEIGGGAGFSYDISPDGQRFLVNTLVEAAASAPITVVVNWMAGLQK